MTITVPNMRLSDLEKLEGYTQEQTRSPYELKRLRNEDHLLILYSTGKLVVQGKNNPFENKENQSKQNSLQTKSLKESIGSDETIKGDTFGGLIVCGAYFKQDEIFVTDSKKYTDKQIIILAQELLEKFSERFIVKELIPEKYNSFYAELGSQTTILNILHKEVGLELKKKFIASHVVDQYPGCNVGDVQEPKAESKYTSVAAASIIARYRGLLQFEIMSKNAGFILPKGSTHVSEAVKEIRRRNLPIDKFCKMHFSTISKK